MRAGEAIRQFLPLAIILLAIFILLQIAGCKTSGAVNYKDADVAVKVKQPENASRSATVTITKSSGDVVEVSTGESHENTLPKLKMQAEQYEIFSYVGAVVCVLGVGLTIAAWWIPLIPKLAGPLVFGGGALTAYMSTAIPEYGPYALAVSVAGLAIWFYHQEAAKRDPLEFKRKSKREKALPKNSTKTPATV